MHENYFNELINTNLDFSNYSIDTYKNNLDEYGLATVWDNILHFVMHNNNIPDILKTENFGELYEIGLAHIDKENKKSMGKYYTPPDVAELMASWLLELQGSNICDVGCGVGNLILAYLRICDNPYELINSSKIYLYDKDPIALKICKYSIGILYGEKLLNKINVIHCDFLDREISLPQDAKVIINPIYCRIKEYSANWEMTPIIKQAKDYYAAFMEKVIKQSVSSVLITPYSFMGAKNFYNLREFLNNYDGFMITFDNVPGNIFFGKKKGIFNTNTSNAVRATITVVENKSEIKGFKTSPMLRFKTSEREQVLNKVFLESTISKNQQIISKTNNVYFKCQKELEPVFENWKRCSSTTFKDLLGNSQYKIYIPDTSRYFITGAVKQLNRTGLICLSFKDEEAFNFAYALLNSSFAYWYWRMVDGGFNLTQTLIENIPIFTSKTTEEQHNEILEIVSEMINKENDYIVTKMNAGKLQENIKFPENYRNKLNKILLNMLDINCSEKTFEVLHKNNLFNEME